MSAYVIIEFTVNDPDVAREKYSPHAAETGREHGREVLANGNWEILHGDPLLTLGALIWFPDHETCLLYTSSVLGYELEPMQSVADQLYAERCAALSPR